jgi:hypothetical protein
VPIEVVLFPKGGRKQARQNKNSFFVESELLFRAVAVIWIQIEKIEKFFFWLCLQPSIMLVWW